MSDDLLIYPDRLATKPVVLQGRFSPGELERLEDSLANGEGELEYRVSAGLDPQRRKVVSCIIEGFVFLMCQNSLEAFRHEISIEDRLVLVESEAQLPPPEQESDEEDYLVATEPVDIRDLVEDAVLLALPMIPRKPGLEATKGGGGEAPPAKESPFAALASLKRKK
jgi:uncharacterized protein